jgi:hypothetical protein
MILKTSAEAHFRRTSAYPATYCNTSGREDAYPLPIRTDRFGPRWPQVTPLADSHDGGQEKTSQGPGRAVRQESAAWRKATMVQPTRVGHGFLFATIYVISLARLNDWRS